MTKQRLRKRNLSTTFGRLEISRYVVKEKASGRSFFLLDDRLGLSPGAEPTPHFLETGIALAAGCTYRQAAELLSLLCGEETSHRALWRWTQGVGRELKAAQEEKRRSTFEDGIAPRRDRRIREIVACEADGAMLRAQREETKLFEVKLGVLYSGKKRVGKNPKHKRYLLHEKAVIGMLADTDAFGQHLALLGEERLALSRAGSVLCLSDGDHDLKRLFENWIPYGIYQLDHFHLRKRIDEAAGDNSGLADRIRSLVFGKRLPELKAELGRAKARGEIDPEKAADLLGYVEGNFDGISAATQLYGRVSDPKMVIFGSGAVEHNIDLLIARRMKRQGMRWTKRGADHLLRLRTLKSSPATWRRWFDRGVA